MSSRPPDNALMTIMGRPPGVNALPMVADVTRVAPARAALVPERRVDTILATPDDWFSNLRRRGARWASDHNMPNVMDYPPLRLLTMVMGENPMESVGGPGQAISAFAKRSPAVMRRFADPDFHRWMIKHGPERGYFSAIRDWAPETVIDDLYQRYLSSDLGKRSVARAAERRAREAGAARGRRRSDAVQ